MSKTKKISLIIHSGTLDKLYPALFLASASAATDVEAHLFFTFWGLNALKKNGLDNAKLPGLMSIGTGMIKNRAKKAKVPTLRELFQICKESGKVKIYACSTTMEMMQISKNDLLPEVDKILGAAAFLDISLDADISLFI